MRNMNIPAFEQIDEADSQVVPQFESAALSEQTESRCPTKLDIRFNGGPEFPKPSSPKVYIDPNDMIN